MDPEFAHERCEAIRDKAFRSLGVSVVLNGLEQTGCALPSERAFVRCEPCDPDGTSLGSYSKTEDGKGRVIICENVLTGSSVSKAAVERTVKHELIHAFDDCRAELDPNNCLHMACTEVRAANLSGDCHLKTEIQRRNFAFKGQGNRCVKRRAQLSLEAHPECKEVAKIAVDKVFDRCIEDNAPFIGKFFT